MNLNEKPGAVRRRSASGSPNTGKDPSCNSCHSMIDPLGFALENFDVIGGWRTVDESGQPVDASGTTVSGATIEGLRAARLPARRARSVPAHGHRKAAGLCARPAARYTDRPVVRQIVRDAAAHQYRWSAIVSGIVESPRVSS
jgi:hypothetical protein